MTRLTCVAAILLGAVLGCEAPGAAPAGVASGAPSAPPAASTSAVPSPPPVAEPRSPQVREGGAIARSLESDALFVADEDHAMVRVLALPAQMKARRADVPVPGRPAQVLVTRDRVLVTIRRIEDAPAGTTGDAGAPERGEGALLVLRRKGGLELEEVGRVALPADAWGVAITPDEDTAVVSSAWTHRVSAVDLKTLGVRWSVDVAREPRGVVVLPEGDRAYVSHLVGSDVTRLDGLRGKEPRVTRVKLPASPMRSPYGVQLPASLGYAAVASPQGDRVYFPRHALGALGPDAWFGAGAVDVLLTADDTPLAPPRAARPTARFVDFFAESMKSQRWLAGANPVIEHGGTLIAEPRAAVYRRRTDTILVANEGDDAVVELDALAMDPTLSGTRRYPVGRNYELTMNVPKHGAAPSGIVLSEREDEAYVFCRATYDVVVLRLPPDRGAYHVAPPVGISLAEETNKPLATGRALFYKGNDPTLSGGLSCAGCHPEGRDDGHVWHEVTFTSDGSREQRFTNFFAGTDLSSLEARWGDVKFEGEGGFGYARQTPMLAGRVAAIGPYGWHGESPDLVARIIAGFGLHRWTPGYDNKTLSRAYAEALAVFLREGLVPPPRLERPLTAEEQRGKAIFESPAAQCSTCHAPATGYTDRAPAQLKKWKPPAGFAEDPNPVYKTPSLLFVGGSPPYLHDGRFESLESLIENNQDRMGKTAQLSADERKALIAFLRTL